MTKNTWQNIYSAGEQLNRYPYDFIVSSFFKYRPANPDGRAVKVLDLGCGAGNHSLFCAENGAEVLAVDYSVAALDVVNRRAAEKGLQQTIQTLQVDFENFELANQSFDVIIDRLAVSHVSRLYAKDVYDHLYESLTSGGIVLSNLFTSGHTHKDYGEYDPEQQIWKSFTGGIFEHLKTACFYTEQEIRQLFSRYELESLARETEQTLKNSGASDTAEQMEIWKIIARKTL